MKLVQQNNSIIYISRSLSACFTRVPLVHSLMLSRSKQDIGGDTLSLSAHGWSQIWPDNLDRGRRVGASFMLSSAAREETNGCPRIPISGRVVLSKRAAAREGLRPLVRPCGIVAKMRPPDAVFATCRRPSGIYSFETCLALLPELFPLRVDHFLLPSAVTKPPRLLLRHVLCTYVLYDRYSYTFSLEREMGTRILSRYHSVFVLHDPRTILK